MTLNSRRRLFSDEDIDRFRRACESISEKSADASGFVPVRTLLERFQARLIIRPLLVEGMFGSMESGSSPGARDWVVLVNSKKYPVADSDLSNESPDRPLDARFRFTVAHELAHSLAFRASDFGIHLRTTNVDKLSSGELVTALEGDADALASALLCAPKTLQEFFRSQERVVKVNDLARLRRRLGVSRQVLLNRIRQVATSNEAGLQRYPALVNTAIGTGTWNRDGSAVFRNWPVFANFDRNLLPKILIDLVHHDRLPAVDAIPDKEFGLCGGNREAAEVSMLVGTPGTLTDENLDLICTFEDVAARREGTRFFWILAGKSRPEDPSTNYHPVTAPG